MLTTETRTIRSDSGYQTIVSSQYKNSHVEMRRISRVFTVLGIVLASLFFGIDTAYAQSVGLNNATPDASSILDLTATDRGLLIPRMSSAQRLAIVSPAIGLIVFDSTLFEFRFYDGTIWTGIGGGDDGDFTNSGNYWTNTTDSFGIGVAVPGAPLHVESTGDFTIGGITSGITGRGLFGEATHLTGANAGVEGVSRSASGVGVYGHNDTISGSTYGVVGQAASVDGTGVFGENTSPTGTTFGVHGTVSSPDGYAGYFDGGNGYFSDSLGIGTLSPASELDVAGTITTGGFTMPSGASNGFVFTTDAGGNASWTDPTILPSDGDWINAGNYWTNMTDSFGIGVSPPSAPLHVQSTGDFAIAGLTTGSIGRGVYGEATDLTGSNIGVQGRSRSAGGIGVYGHNDTITGATYGVFGEVASSSGTGVLGSNTSVTGTTYGVHGTVASPSGYAGYFDGGKSYFSDTVSIGTTTPSNFVHLVQPSTFYMKLESQAADPFGIILENPNRIWYFLHSPGSYDGLSFYDDTRGEHVMFFDGPTGYVGINTVLPSEALHVYGNIKLDSAIYDMNDDPGTSGQVLTSTGTQLDWVDAASLSDGDWTDAGNYVTNMTDSIGIGTATPSTKLTIDGKADNQPIPLLDIVNGDSASAIAFTTDFRIWEIGQNRPPGSPLLNDVFFIHDVSASSTRFMINTIGDVGIGNTAPSNKLSVTGNADVTGDFSIGIATAGILTGSTKYLTLHNDGGYTPTSITSLEISSNLNSANATGAKIDFFNNFANTNTARIAVNTTGRTDEGQLLFFTREDPGAITERMRITETGDVGIGMTPSEKLDVSGTIGMTGFLLSTSPSAGYVLTSDGSGYGSWTDPTSAGNFIDNQTAVIQSASWRIGGTAEIDGSAPTLASFSNASTVSGQAVFAYQSATSVSNATVYGVYGASSAGDNSSDASYTATAGVYGAANGASQVVGAITNTAGVWAISTGTSGIGTTTNYGLIAQAQGGSNNDNYGILSNADGTTTGSNFGIYATASNGAANWAGFFNGAVNISGAFTLADGSQGVGYYLMSDGTGNATWTDPASMGDYIQNQTASPQSASFRINGTGEINGSGSTQFDVASSSSGSGIVAVSGTVTAGTNDAGVRGSATSTSAGVHYGLYGEALGVNVSSSNIALFGYATGGADNWGANLIGEYSSTSAAEDILVIDRTTSGTPANGIGASLVLRANNTSGGISHAGRISGILTNASASSSTALTFETQTGGGGLTERARIDADGDLGVGTTNPLRRLHASTSTDDFQLRLAHPSSTAFSYDIGRDVSDGRLHFYGNQTTWSGYEFEGVGGKYLTIEYDGDIGIGDDTPDGKLEVRQTSTSDIFNLYDNTTNVFTVEDGGNVGIGVTNPSDKLEVSGDVTITGELTVTGNDISFSAYNSASDAKSSGWFKAEFNAEKHDDGTDYNVSTDRFTAPSAGVYHFSSSVSINSAPNATRIVVALYKNGGSELILQSGYTNTTGNWQSFGGSGNIKLVASDYIEVYVYMDQSATHYGASSMYTNFSGHKLY